MKSSKILQIDDSGLYCLHLYQIPLSIQKRLNLTVKNNRFGAVALTKSDQLSDIVKEMMMRIIGLECPLRL
jgi:hypothetical protein